ncbi:hypothetical protein FACS189494_05170 [Spirochaetia bacterium]|nr:hypothetical protein FACS189494_05170 [Spirochaetia bacterium]
MANLYPDEQTLSIFGENVSWPGLDQNGKFTNGSFDNPLVKPSFFPAQTVNLILDNLAAAIAAAGFNPNNADADQLKKVFAVKANLASPTFTGTPKVPSKTSAAANDGTLIATEAQVNLKANLASPTFTGTPKVPNKTSAAANDGTLIATEAQVNLKANLASPSFTGTPVAPKAAAKTNTAQIATTSFVLDATYPVGSIYIRYPTISGMTTVPLPADKFGGTWANVSSYYAGRFFRVEGGNAAAFGSAQADAIRNISGSVTNGLSNPNPGIPLVENNVSGAFSISPNTSQRGEISSVGYVNQGVYFNFSAANVVPTAAENRPVNYSIQIWQRTA